MWDDTTSILGNEIAKVTGIDKVDARNMIERSHRSRPNQRKAGKRNIFAAFHDWNDSEFVKEAFRTAASKNKNNGIYVDQKYGSDTTWRRNQALIRRKELKAAKTITNGYVSFPAKLMVKYKSTDKSYVPFEKFSKMEVVREEHEVEDINES